MAVRLAAEAMRRNEPASTRERGVLVCTASVPFPNRLPTPEDHAKLLHQIGTNEMLNGEVIRLTWAIRLAPK